MAAVAMLLSLAVLILSGFLFNEMRTNSAEMARLTGELRASINKLEEATTGNSAQLMDVRQEVADTKQEINGLKTASLASRLKSRSAVLAGLAQNLDGPLKVQTTSLADKLASF